MTIDIAVVGIGKIALDQHLPNIERNDDFRLAAVVSRRGVGHGNVPVFGSAAELYAAMPEVSAVAFCTPPEGRHAAVMEALEAGRHVLIEKPPTTTTAEFQDLERMAQGSGSTLFATWHSQFNPSIETVRDVLVREGVRKVSIVWRESVWRWHPGQEWIWQPGGFGVFDPGINALSILTEMMPFSVFVEDCLLEVPQGREMPIAARIRFTGGTREAEIMAEFDWRERVSEVWDIDITTGSGTRLLMRRGGGELYVDGALHHPGPKQEYKAIYEKFAQLIRDGKSLVDGAPLRLTADAFLLGRRKTVAAFDWND